MRADIAGVASSHSETPIIDDPAVTVGRDGASVIRTTELVRVALAADLIAVDDDFPAPDALAVVPGDPASAAASLQSAPEQWVGQQEPDASFVPDATVPASADRLTAYDPIAPERHAAGREPAAGAEAVSRAVPASAGEEAEDDDLAQSAHHAWRSDDDVTASQWMIAADMDAERAVSAFSARDPQSFGTNSDVLLNVGNTNAIGNGPVFSNQDINGILSGYKWDETTITFSFPLSASNYGAYPSSEPFDGFQPLIASQQTVARTALNLIGGYTGLTFVEMTETNVNHAVLRFAGSNTPSTSWAYYPFPDARGGDVWLGNVKNDNPVVAGYAFDTILHEIGHALGLKHGHVNDDGVNDALSPTGIPHGLLPAPHDSTEWSLMTYHAYVGTPNDFYSNAQGSGQTTFMMNDIAALQYMYGANYNTNSGATVYSWVPGAGQTFINGVGQGATFANKIFRTIWDGGGNDTYDLSKYTGSVTVNLNPGEWSTFSTAQLANLGDGRVAHGNLANAHLFNGDTKSLIENAIGGSGADILIGNSVGNTLTGNGGNDMLRGGAGPDVLIGGPGNDIYEVDDPSDKITEVPGEGTADLIRASISISLDAGLGTPGVDGIFGGQDIENVTLLDGKGDLFAFGNALNNVLTGNNGKNKLQGGAGNDTLHGNGDNDSLFGQDGNDTLNGGDGDDFVLGGTGNDTMTGGAGNDGYHVDSLGDKVIETAVGSGNGFIDTVFTDIDFSIASLGNIEILVANNAADLKLTGNAAANQLFGGDGNNTLDGGAGIDLFFSGGKGNDTYILDNVAEIANVFEDANVGDGIDTVKTAVLAVASAFAGGIANVENYAFTGSGVWKFTGTAGDNVITGGTGNDELSGANGKDTLIGGAGNDGLSGDADQDTLFGDAGNDLLDGGAGADDLRGGIGNDTFFVNEAGDKVTETAGQGIDTIQTTAKIDIDLESGNFLNQEIENVTAGFGFGAITFTGNKLNNVLSGNEGADRLVGGDGNDTLNGNGADDILFGDNGNDTLNGGEGKDTLVGGVGADKMDGGDGDDSLNVFDINHSAAEQADGAVDTMIGGKGDDTYNVYETLDMVIETITNANGGGIDTVITDIDFSIASLGNVDNIAIIGVTGFEGIKATGNAAVNRLTGNSGSDTLDGGAGIDFFVGGRGNDTYILDQAAEADNVHVKENSNAGTDTVKTAVLAIANAIDNVENYTFTGTGSWSFTGNALDNVITGAAGNDTLNGGDGNDTLIGGTGGDQMTGGQGNDTFYIDNALDTVIEGGAGGTDKLVSSLTIDLSKSFLGQEIEDIFLTGTAALNATGIGGKNNLVGNDGANILDGGGGVDRLAGGKGNDTYFFDDAGDRAFELRGEGIDTLKTSVNVDFSGGALQNREIENIIALDGATSIRGNELNNIILGNNAGNFLSGGAGNDTITGGTADDSLEGGEGNDILNSGGNNTGNGAVTVLNGGDGNDTMTGGTGNDQYVVDSAGDKVIESVSNAANGGTADEVVSAITFSIAALANIENLTLVAGFANINGTGNAGVNVLTGNSGDNTLDGGAGNDVLNGGLGNDTLIGGDGIDTFDGGDGDDTFILDNIAEFGNVTDGSGNDTIKTAVLFSQSNFVADIENYAYTGSSKFTFDATGLTTVKSLIGGSASDILTGSSGETRLDGGAGADTLIGKGGADIFVVDNLGDTISDTGGANALFINRSINLATAILAQDKQFSAVISDVTLTGAAALNLTGDNAVNILTGNAGANKLDGNHGADTLIGGKGDDTYFVYGEGETVIENDNEGIDTVVTTATISLQFDAPYAGQKIENAIAAVGLANIDVAGNELVNVITGNDGNNQLNGLGGNDTMTGGKGDDIYFVDSVGDKVVETLSQAAGGGLDLVVSDVSFSLAALANVELVELTGSDNLNATGNAGINTLTGNTGHNILDGGAGNDTLIGGDGNDTLIGGAGTDTFDGGAGDDTYVVDSLAEFANIQDSGNSFLGDTLKSSVVFDQNTPGLPAFIENFSFTGSAKWTFNISGVGGSHALTGGSGADVLTTGGGDDRLDGGAGADSMNGGKGSDTYVIDNVGDKITDIEEVGDNDSIIINRSVNLTVAISAANDQQFILNGIEHVTLSGTAALNATGNGGRNILIGNDAANILDGGTGDDVLSGGKGNDTYIIYDEGEDINEFANEGTDTIKSNFGVNIGAGSIFSGAAFIENIMDLDPNNGAGVIFTGNDLNNALTGGKGDDTLDGGKGNDTMTGAAGDDTYIVDNIADKVVESLAGAAGGLNDLIRSAVTFSLVAAANVENLQLTGATGAATDTDAINGTGNTLGNAITGNDGNNTLDGGAGNDTLIGGAGNDTLIGGAGNDTFDGGAGNDTFVLDNLVEFGMITDASGSDTIKTALAFTEANAVAGVENYWYTGSAKFTFDAGALTGVAHALTGGSGADVLTGADKDDTLDGGTGADKMFGGAGSDRYLVDNIGDVVDEQGNTDANDAVFINRSVNLQTDFLGAIEHATLTGTAAIDATGTAGINLLVGNDGNNKLSGLSGDDTLIGGKGDDTLTGGAGADNFVYAALTDRGTGLEVITDFNRTAGDKLDLRDLLGGIGSGANAVADGFLAFVDDGKGNTIVMIDADGSAGAAGSFQTLVTVRDVADPNDVAFNTLLS